VFPETILSLFDYVSVFALLALAVVVNNDFSNFDRDSNSFQMFLFYGNCLHDLDFLIDEGPVVYLDSFAFLSIDSASNVDLKPVLVTLEFTARLL